MRAVKRVKCSPQQDSESSTALSVTIASGLSPGNKAPPRGQCRFRSSVKPHQIWSEYDIRPPQHLPELNTYIKHSQYTLPIRDGTLRLFVHLWLYVGVVGRLWCNHPKVDYFPVRASPEESYQWLNLFFLQINERCVMLFKHSKLYLMLWNIHKTRQVSFCYCFL